MSAISKPIHRVERKITRLQRFDSNGNMTDLLAILRSERFTGALTLHLFGGSVQAIEATDSCRIDEPD